MKYFILIMLFLNSLLYSGDVFITPHVNRADIKVFIEHVPFHADLLVYKETTSILAKNFDQYWRIVKYENLAKVKIHYVKYRNLADISIYFVSNKFRAKWRTLDHKLIGKFK